MKKFLKYLFRIAVGLFALIGVLAVCAYWYLASSEKYYISIGENEVITKESKFVDLLKQSRFKADTAQYHFACFPFLGGSETIKQPYNKH